jgi:hypothetical protein
MSGTATGLRSGRIRPWRLAGIVRTRNSTRNVAIAALVGAVAVSGCSSTGSADGKRPINNTEKGALIGAVGSGLAGAAVGNYLDRQKQDLEKTSRPSARAAR